LIQPDLTARGPVASDEEEEGEGGEEGDEDGLAAILGVELADFALHIHRFISILLFVFSYIYMYIYMCVCVCIYIYIYGGG